MASLTKRVMIRLSDEAYRELKKVSEHNRRAPSTLARFLIEEALGLSDNGIIDIPTPAPEDSA